MKRNGKNTKNKVFEFIKAPNLLFMCFNWFLTLALVALCIVCIARDVSEIFSYIIYAAAAISLTYSIYTAVRFATKIKQRFLLALKKHKLTRPLAESGNVRIIVFAVVSFVINVGFVAFNTALAFMTRNVWYGALAIYYLLLSLLRGAVLIRDRREKSRFNESDYFKAQLKNFRSCGIGLILLDVAISGAVTLMVLQQKPAKYSEVIAIAMAAYTFYKITLAVINVLKAKKSGNVQILSLRNISLTDAAISLLSLQTALISVFSDGGNSLLPLNFIYIILNFAHLFKSCNYFKTQRPRQTWTKNHMSCPCT